VVAEVTLVKLEVEVVTAAVFGGGHDEILSFFAYDYPYGSAARLKHILFDSMLF
jgi:hypothetical protein